MLANCTTEWYSVGHDAIRYPISLSAQRSTTPLDKLNPHGNPPNL
ncbi:hypothetical protein [Spirosoma foliorum]|nr:hypothetical protein [Spirosoma foliorum]